MVRPDDLRLLAKYIDLPATMLSEKHLQNAVQRGMHVGFECLLLKPSCPAEIFFCWRRGCSQRRRGSAV